MALPVIIGLASLAMGAYSMVKANQDKKKAESDFRDAMANRPGYTPTESSKKLTAATDAERNSLSPAVMMAYQQAQQQAASERAQAQRNATSGAEVLSMGSASQNAFQSSLPGLIGAQENIRRGNQQNYYAALGEAGRQEEMQQADRQARSADVMNYNLGRMQGANATASQGMGLAASGVSALGSYYSQPKNTVIVEQPNIRENIQPINNTYGFQQMPAQSSRPMLNGRYDPYTGQWIANN